MARLAHSDTESAVWMPAGCRTGAGTEAATRAGAADDTGSVTGIGTEAKPGTENLGSPIAEDVSELVDEPFGGAKVGPEAETGAVARPCPAVGTSIGTEVGTLIRVEPGKAAV